MAEFIPDGHKYGWKLKEPWGLNKTAKDRFGLYTSNLRFVIGLKGGGGVKTLGLIGTWVDSKDQTVWAEHPASVYFKLAYQEASIPFSNALLTQNPIDQPLEDNEYLVRLTVTNKDPAADPQLNHIDTETSTPGAANYRSYCVQNLFHERPDKNGAGVWSWTIRKEADPAHYDWDCCFEFSANKSPKVISLSVCIDATNTNSSELSIKNGFILYLDDYQELQSGGGIMTQPVDPRSVKTIAQPSPMGLLYKHTNGTLYQMNTSNYATQAEYEALLARVAALEAAKAGA